MSFWIKTQIENNVASKKNVSVSNDIAELESYKKALSKELDSLKKEIEISKYDVSRIKELDLKIFETVSELSTKEKELDNTINDIDFNNSKLSEIQNNIETLNKDLSLIKKEVFTADKNKIELENKIKDIEGVLSDRKMFLDKVNEDASSIEKRVRALEDKEQLLKKDVSVFNERVKKAGDSISKKQSELFDINEDVLLALSNKKDLLAEISNLSKDKWKLSTEVFNLGWQIKDLELIYNNVKKDIDVSNEQLNSINEDFVSTSTFKKDLDEKIIELLKTEESLTESISSKDTELKDLINSVDKFNKDRVELEKKEWLISEKMFWLESKEKNLKDVKLQLEQFYWKKIDQINI